MRESGGFYFDGFTVRESKREKEREREGKNVGERSNKKKMPHLREGGKKFVAAKNN